MFHFFILIYNTLESVGIDLNLVTILGRVSSTKSISSSVVFFPKVILTEDCAISSVNPIDFRTCDGSKEADVQALPLEAAIPSKSKLNNMDSPSIS